VRHGIPFYERQTKKTPSPWGRGRQDFSCMGSLQRRNKYATGSHTAHKPGKPGNTPATLARVLRMANWLYTVPPQLAE